jgi:hypothetical protein
MHARSIDGERGVPHQLVIVANLSGLDVLAAPFELPRRGTRLDQMDPAGPDNASNVSGGIGSTP